MTAPQGVEEVGHEPPPFSPVLVEDMLKLLDKAIRAHQLYMHNNPTYIKTVENVRASSAAVVPPTWRMPRAKMKRSSSG